MKKKAIRRQLSTILAKLETMQMEIEATLANIDMYALGIDGEWNPPAYPGNEYLPCVRDHGPIGVIPQEAVGWYDPNTMTGTSVPTEHTDLRTYEIMPDGTRRECAE